MSKDLMMLYDFIINELVQINVTKDMKRSEPVIAMLTELRDAWKAVKTSTNSRVYYEED